MPVKCGACGRFVSGPDTARCSKCSAAYHRGCVGLHTKGQLATIWHCPECKRNVRRDNKADTPVRGCVGEMQSELVTMPVSSLPAEMSSVQRTPTGEIMTPISTAAPPTPPSAAASPSPGAMGVDSRMIPEFPQDVGSALKLVVDELRTLRFEVLELRRDVAELKASNDSSHNRMDAMESRLEALEKRGFDGCAPSAHLGPVESVVEQLRRDLNDRDQELMANDLLIANVPESQGENPNHLFQVIATKLGVALEERDIVCAERVGGRHIKATSPSASTVPRPRAIMVRLARREQRDAVLDGARVRRGATTDNLGLAGEPVRFYVNERLTRTNHQLFRQAKVAAGIHGWRFVWTKRGRILVRNKPGGDTHRITSVEDVQQIIGPFADTNK